MKRQLGFLLPIVAATMACSGLLGGNGLLATPTVPNSYKGFEGVNAAAVGSHRSQFTLEFQSDQGWLYRVETRTGATAVEHSLQIEGVEDAANPGDVRMVTEGDVSRMIGPGTEDRCLQFPAELSVNVSFLGPDDVLPPAAIKEPMVGLGQEEVAGRPAAHFALVQDDLDGWQDVVAGMWIDLTTDAVLRYDLLATGWDPFFNAGWGQVSGRYRVEDIGPQAIDPIEGCQVPFPLPPNHRGLVIVPGVVAFETAMELREVGDFYRQQLADTDWKLLDQQESASGAMVLSYHRGAETLDITIRQMEDHVRVELLTD